MRFREIILQINADSVLRLDIWQLWLLFLLLLVLLLLLLLLLVGLLLLPLLALSLSGQLQHGLVLGLPAVDARLRFGFGVAASVGALVVAEGGAPVAGLLAGARGAPFGSCAGGCGSRVLGVDLDFLLVLLSILELCL